MDIRDGQNLNTMKIWYSIPVHLPDASFLKITNLQPTVVRQIAIQNYSAIQTATKNDVNCKQIQFLIYVSMCIVPTS